MAQRYAKPVFVSLTLALLLLFSIGNTPQVNALPAADNLVPGEWLHYYTSSYVSWDGNTHVMVYEDSNGTGIQVYFMEYIEQNDFWFSEFGNATITSVTTLSNGNELANATTSGIDDYGYSSYIQVYSYDAYQLEPEYNGTYPYSDSWSETFTDEYLSFEFNDTQVPIFTSILEEFIEPANDAQAGPLSLSQMDGPPPNPGTAGNFTFIENYLDSLVLIFQNSTSYYNTSYILNNETYNLNVVRFGIFNMTTVNITGDVYDMFFAPYNLSGALWHAMAIVTLYFDVGAVYDVDTGLLLDFYVNMTLTKDLYASALYYDVDVDGTGPLNATDYFVEFLIKNKFSTFFTLMFDGASYLYTSGGNVTTTTPTTTPTTNNTTTNNTTQNTDTNATTPLLNLPVGDYVTISVGLVSTLIAITIIKKRRI